MTSSRSLVWLCIATALGLASSACGGKQPPPAAPPANTAVRTKPPAGGSMTADEVAAATHAMLDKIGVAIAAASGDCKKMGSGLTVLTSELNALMAKAKTFDRDPVMRKEFEDKHSAGVVKKMESWVQPVQACIEDAEVKAFFEVMTR